HVRYARGSRLARGCRMAARRRSCRGLAGARAGSFSGPACGRGGGAVAVRGGLQDLYDATIAVVAEEALRRERAASRGHALVEERAARQLSQREKAQRATFVVHNDGTEADLERELSAVLDKLGG